MARSVIWRCWPWRWRLPCSSCLCVDHFRECAGRKLYNVFRRTENSGVSIPSTTLPSWLPASLLSLGIFSFSLKPPSLLFPVFFLDATLMVASSSVRVTRISQVSLVLRRGCSASLTFPILSHGAFLGMTPSRSMSEEHRVRQFCVVILIGTGGYREGSNGGQLRGSMASLGLGPRSLGSTGSTAESEWPRISGQPQGYHKAADAVVGESKKKRPGGVEGVAMRCRKSFLMMNRMRSRRSKSG